MASDEAEVIARVTDGRCWVGVGERDGRRVRAEVRPAARPESFAFRVAAEVARGGPSDGPVTMDAVGSGGPVGGRVFGAAFRAALSTFHGLTAADLEWRAVAGDDLQLLRDSPHRAG